VEVEAHLQRGVPGFSIVGLPDKACQEAKERVRSGIASAELEWPLRRITVNLAPAGLRKEGSGFDLPIALSILAASGQIPRERLADHAEGVSRCVKRLAGQALLKPLIDIPRMEALVQEMLREAMEAFKTRDASLARAMAKKDDDVDGLRSQIFRELLTFMISDPKTVPRALELLLAAQHLERAADHVTNIGERVVYMVTGELLELNV